MKWWGWGRIREYTVYNLYGCTDYWKTKISMYTIMMLLVSQEGCYLSQILLFSFCYQRDSFSPISDIQKIVCTYIFYFCGLCCTWWLRKETRSDLNKIIFNIFALLSDVIQIFSFHRFKYKEVLHRKICIYITWLSAFDKVIFLSSSLSCHKFFIYFSFTIPKTLFYKLIQDRACFMSARKQDANNNEFIFIIDPLCSNALNNETH